MSIPLLDLLWCGPDTDDDITAPREDRVPLMAEPPVVRAQDGELVERIRAGDDAAFRTMYLAHFQSLWRFAMRLVRSTDVATDAVQDVFASLWTRREQWIVTGTLRTYLYGAVRHRALAMLRDARVAERAATRIGAEDEIPGLGAPLGDAAERVAQDELAATIARAIETLPERQRTAVLLRWNDDMNAAEIGRVLGISDTAARKLLHSARRRIEAMIPWR